MGDENWGARLRRVRERRKWTQGELAEKLKASQAEISRWEQGRKAATEEVVKLILRQENELGLPAEVPSENISPDFSFSKQLFERYWSESPKRIESLDLKAVVKSIKGENRFADVEMTLTFKGMHLPKNDPLYYDCLGVSPPLEGPSEEGAYGFYAKDCSLLKWGGAEFERGSVTEWEKTKKELGPHVIAYEFRDIDERQTVVVRLNCIRGVNTAKLDAIGAPVYADCPVKRLSMSVTFRGLRPVDRDAVDAHEYLLRRTLFHSRPANLIGGLKVQLRKSSETFSFQNLLYPRMGFGYCIAWGSLEKI